MTHDSFAEAALAQMVSRADKARSRNREEALAVIVPRLRELMLSGAPGRTGGVECTTNQIGSLSLVFARSPAATEIYFAIREAKQVHMTGYLDPVPPGRYLGGKVHVVTWYRGDWQSQLFRDAQVPTKLRAPGRAGKGKGKR